LKHPGIVRILEPLEETRTQFLLVTEEVLGSLQSWLQGTCRFQLEVCLWMNRCASFTNGFAPPTHIWLRTSAYSVAVVLSITPLFAQVDSEPLSDLEIKHGLENVANTLTFLHTSCKLAHCNLSLASVIIAADGSWKLSGLGLTQRAAPSGAPFNIPWRCHFNELTRPNASLQGIECLVAERPHLCR
jgi:hypothetical protein